MVYVRVTFVNSTIEKKGGSLHDFHKRDVFFAKKSSFDPLSLKPGKAFNVAKYKSMTISAEL
jgi:hypothetical protein